MSISLKELAKAVEDGRYEVWVNSNGEICFFNNLSKRYYVMDCTQDMEYDPYIDKREGEQMTYTEKELDQFLHGISLSLLSKKSAQHWRYDEETAKEIEWLEALERKVRADKADRKTENSSEKPNNCEGEQMETQTETQNSNLTFEKVMEEIQTQVIEFPDTHQKFTFARKIEMDGDSIKIGDWEYKGAKMKGSKK